VIREIFVDDLNFVAQSETRVEEDMSAKLPVNSPGAKNGGKHQLYRLTAALAPGFLLAGAVGAVGLTLWTGRHNNSLLLKALFTVWVLSPFAALFLARRLARKWSDSDGLMVDCCTVIVSLLTLLFYGYVAFGPARPQTASTFVIVPPVSGFFIGSILFAAFKSSRDNGGGAS
jgi:hypothetical protein